MNNVVKLGGLATAACAACCAVSILPAVLAGSGAAALLAAAVAWLPAIGVAVVLIGLAYFVQRRPTRATTPQALVETASGCDCGNCSSPAGNQRDTMPIACSLDGNDRKDRLDWVEQLSRRSLRSVTRSDLTLDLTHAAEALSDVRELVAREQECCTFLSFDLRHDAKGVHLRITAPEQAREVAAELFAYFAPKLAPEVTQ